MKMGRGLATTSSMPVGITDYAIISLLRTLLCALKRKVAWGEGCWRHRSSKGVDDGSGSNARAAGDEEKDVASNGRKAKGVVAAIDGQVTLTAILCSLPPLARPVAALPTFVHGQSREEHSRPWRLGGGGGGGLGCARGVTGDDGRMATG
ncbi:hypothetical protein BHE74_00022807 [Ensete ventricosum]|nr:hypothetical protein BHE74_00022807 [Ensete ventricosum]